MRKKIYDHNTIKYEDFPISFRDIEVTFVLGTQHNTTQYNVHTYIPIYTYLFNVCEISAVESTAVEREHLLQLFIRTEFNFGLPFIH